MANLPAEMSDQLVVDALVQLGFEVESQVRFPLVEGVKFGRVHAVEPNPSADRLAVCQVVFNDQTRTIQTSATNVRVGAVVAAFVSGSRLGETVFSPRKMQGVVSEGMLISLSEVGYASALLGPLGQGITLFEAEMDLDHDPVDLLGLNDTLLDITVLPNRPNSRCYQAIARELAAFFHRQVPREHWNKFRAQGSLKVSVPAGNEYVLIGANADFKLT
ncbi:uncharacterized protein LOC111627186 [Centruroides sculpturatus]|uniref:uncharacterized protein LOC111627186 n=1 Tax=Centruroides sculpturatus TaxID=218467 RepID=UPI000C6EB2DC|nr:uncharacterized protein LOC111627186 [Centruroides sculpturatus]